MISLRNLAAALLVLLSGQASAATFDIQINFSGDTFFQSFFEDAALEIESFVTGYRTSNPVAPLAIDAFVETIDGSGGILGQAGPTAGVITGGFTYATSGLMRFDTDDVGNLVANALFDDVVLHEMIHTLGLGTLWAANGVYTPGSGQYTGAAGLAAYRDEFNQPNATYIPVEQDGGPGTSDAHWDENWAGGPDALMTGFVNLGPNANEPYLTNTSVQSLFDIGYLVADISDPIAPVPLPAGGALTLWASATFFYVRRRQLATA